MNGKMRLLTAAVTCVLLIGGIVLYEENADAQETSGDREALLRHDLQERLANVIEDYDNVEDALVFIVPDEGEESDSMVSIFVTTDSGRLTDEVAAGIRRTVNQAVEDLSAENIAIEDQDGNIYGETE